MAWFPSNQNAINGSVSSDLFQDAVALEDIFSQGEHIESWSEWPLLATDGDTAALLQLVSDSKVCVCLLKTLDIRSHPRID